LYTLVGLTPCNFYCFFDGFIENLHIERIEIAISFAIFICFFDKAPRAPLYSQVRGREDQCSQWQSAYV
jgi:hypothetical protein